MSDPTPDGQHPDPQTPDAVEPVPPAVPPVSEPDAGAARQARRSRTTMFVLIGIVVLVIIVALVAVFARSGPTAYDESTPEGVVQRYSQAVVDGDDETALTYLLPVIADDCEHQSTGTQDMRVTLVKTTGDEDRTRVEVLIATVYGDGPFGPSEYENEGVFELSKVGGDWRISTTPWEFVICLQTEPR
ncbi:hypothetical protein ABZ477_04705 [Microbacterium sp. NPDC019599]|uniref:hypothetical protein n=1 Tax=Microbacterium sp. NPDC019599 TaxID=3154690 RepID=UPI0033CBE722